MTDATITEAEAREAITAELAQEITRRVVAELLLAKAQARVAELEGGADERPAE